MNEHSFLFLIILLTTLASMAQLPEMSVTSKFEQKTSSSIQIARNAFAIGDYVKAKEMYFQELDKGALADLDYLYFANTLLANQKSFLANEIYKEYATRSGDEKIKDEINQLLNSSENQYIATNGTVLPIYSNPKYYLGNLYIGNRKSFDKYLLDRDGIPNYGYSILKVPKGFKLGSATFFNQEKQAVVSLINETNNKSSLYYYSQKKGKWEKPKLLFNERYNYAFPFVNEVNSTLYFSSDVGGGIGGYDIYIRTFNNDNFTDLVNLGPQINSPKHDINPTIIDNWLYFSSNGFVSYGGYDIYKYKSLGDYSHVFRNCSDLNTHKDEIGVFGLSQRKITVYRDNDSSILLSSYE